MNSYLMNGLYVFQNGQWYQICTPQGLVIAQIYTGADGQMMQDALALNIITKALGKRWGIPSKQN